MPVGFQVVLDFDLNSLISLRKIWRKCASGQIATGIEFFLSRKFSIGGSSFSDIFLFPSSTALSGLLLVNDQYKRPNANFS